MINFTESELKIINAKKLELHEITEKYISEKQAYLDNNEYAAEKMAEVSSEMNAMMHNYIDELLDPALTFDSLIKTLNRSIDATQESLDNMAINDSEDERIWDDDEDNEEEDDEEDDEDNDEEGGQT